MKVARARSRLSVSWTLLRWCRAHQNGMASAKSPPHLAKAVMTSGVMMLEVASVISVNSTSTGRSFVTSALMRRTISAC